MAKEAIVFHEEYVEQGVEAIESYHLVQTEYAGARQTETWSERLIAQFGDDKELKRGLYSKKSTIVSYSLVACSLVLAQTVADSQGCLIK